MNCEGIEEVECPSCWCAERLVDDCDACNGLGYLDAAKAQVWCQDNYGRWDDDRD